MISNDKDQKEVLRKLDDICNMSADTLRRVTRIDARIHDSIRMGVKNNEQQ